MNLVKFFISFHVWFIILSLSSVVVFDKYGGEIFAGAFWFNIFYIIADAIWISLMRFLQNYFDRKVDSFAANFLISLLFINFLIVLADGSKTLPSIALIKSIPKHDEAFYIDLILHLTFIISFTLSYAFSKDDNEKVLQ